MPMNITQQKEQFSLAYVHAVASASGYAVYDPRVDDQSVDIGLSGYETGSFCDDPRLEIQAKCTESPDYIKGGSTISFQLDRKNYDDLRKNAAVPRILVVVIVPKNVSSWLDQTTTEMIFKHCGYWVSIHGAPTITTESKKVHLPTSNVFNGDEIGKIMRRVADGRKP